MGRKVFVASAGSAVSARAVKGRTIRNILLVCLAAAIGFAAWAWLRPYEKNPDPAAGCRIASAALTRDHSFYWLNLDLKTEQWISAESAKLLTADGKSLRPTDASPGGDGALLRFWVESTDLAGPLGLSVGEGRLTVKSTSGVPEMADKATLVFRNHRW